MAEFKIGPKMVGDGHPTYFIAEISANHDGDLGKAIALIHMAADAGADCAKFQHFRADHIASFKGFEQVGKLAHQAGWNENPYDVFKRLTVPWDWTPKLKEACDKAGVEFMSTPYDIETVAHLNEYVNAFKVGSGDINYFDLHNVLDEIGKPILLGTGASELAEVVRAASWLEFSPLCLMQCNTNYTGEDANDDCLNLNVLRQYAELYPSAVLGLSDHTNGLAAILGAVALGARVIERHFTDDFQNDGPDHLFSMTPAEFEAMVEQTRSLERALGVSIKRVEINEQETVVLQRRCIRAARDLPAGHRISLADMVMLRPAPKGSFEPCNTYSLFGKILTKDIAYGEHFSEDRIQ